MIQRGAITALLAAIVLVLPGSAAGTVAYELHYTPPLVKFDDPPEFGTVENLRLTRVGSSFRFLNSPGGFVVAADPKFECEVIPEGRSCPIAGVRRMLVRLGGENDRALINLGASAERVKQTVQGMDGEDRITGKAGRQRITGGTGNDILKGGQGRDVLIGGPGDDTCRGGPGKDKLKSC